MSFRTRLILLGGGLAILAVLLTTAVLTWHARSDLVAAAEREAHAIGELLGRSASLTEETASVHDLMDLLISGEGIDAVWVLNAAGDTVAVGHGNDHTPEITLRELEAAALGRTNGGTFSYFTDTDLTVITTIDALDAGGRWSVVLRMEREGLDHSLGVELLISGAIFVVIAVLAVGVMSMLATWIARPVTQVAAAAKAVENKTFTPAMLAAMARRGDEFGQLAGVFISMAREVLGREEILAGLVRERTRELADKNLLLEAATARIAEELRVTQHLQISILPTQALERADAQVSARMVPAREVGGDFYDFMALDDGRIAVVIGDVSGKGVPAAFFMAIARTILRRLALTGGAPADIIALANDELCEVNPLELFVTAFVGIFEGRDGSFTYANAGHNPPCLIGADGDVSFLARTGGMALGVMPDLAYGERTITLGPGESVFLYTDGVTEAFDAAGAQFEEERMLALLRERTPRGTDLVERMIGAVEAFSEGVDRSDDVTVLCLDRPSGAVCDDGLPRASLTITIANRDSELARLAGEVRHFAATNALPPRAAMHLDMALEEIVTNIIKYGTKDDACHTIDVSLARAGDRLSITVSDDSAPFDPLSQAPEADTTSELEDRAVGGLGIHILQNVMAEMDYRRADDRNVLKMVLDLNPPA